ncbi:TPA: hypothetical protein QDZ62_001142 [Stenotrophomonas maltophilia]|nr:hypothetical protein [Stenotrophomonas maltophilia]
MHEAETEALVKLELRLCECERRLSNAEGKTNALEYAVRASVASSANPTAVRVAWAHLMPMIVDNHVPPQPGSNAAFLLGLRHGLRFVAEQIDALP